MCYLMRYRKYVSNDSECTLKRALNFRFNVLLNVV
jgi:hypothetical protein